MSWIPPYAVDACLKALATRFEGADHRPENVVTRLGLQFWGPAEDGGLEFVRHDGIRVGAADVEKVVAFAHERGISAALCVYNYDGAWNWEKYILWFRIWPALLNTARDSGSSPE